MNRSIILIAAFLLSNIIALNAQNAEEVLGKMDALMLAPKDKQSHFKMTLLDKNGRGKVREADLFQRGTGERLTRYTKPETQAGISTLFWPEGKGVLWLYMPVFDWKYLVRRFIKKLLFTITCSPYYLVDREPSSYSPH